MVGLVALPKTVSFRENLVLVSAALAALWFALATRAAAGKDLRHRQEPGSR